MVTINAPEPSSPTKWQSIRPWNPRLSLAVREITSVSATFVLTSLSASTNLSAVILDGEDDDGQDADDPAQLSGAQGASDAQAKGLSVKVNGSSWDCVHALVDDEADDEIEFGIVPGEDHVKGQIITEHASTKGLSL
jgi:hypothetical protein